MLAKLSDFGFAGDGNLLRGVKFPNNVPSISTVGVLLRATQYTALGGMCPRFA